MAGTAKPHTVPSGTGDQLPVTSSGLGLGTQSPAIGWGLTGDWGLSLQPEGWDWGLSHQLMLGTALRDWALESRLESSQNSDSYSNVT